MKDVVAKLFSLGLTPREITDLLPAGVKVYQLIQEFGGVKAFPNRPKKDEKYGVAFGCYAVLETVDAHNAHLADDPFWAIHKALKTYIGEDELLAQIRGMTFAAASTLMPAIPSDRQGYAELAREMGLLRRIDPNDLTDAHHLWSAFLYVIAKGQRLAPNSPIHAGMMLAQEVLNPCRAGAKTVWPDEAFMLFDLAIATLAPFARRVVLQHFGIGCEAKSVQEIAEGEFLTVKRIYAVLKSAIKKLRTRRHRFGLHLLVEPAGALLQRELQRRLPPSKAASEPSIDVLTLEVELEHFQNIPIAAKRRLQQEYILRIGDLVTMSRIEVLKLVRRRSTHILTEILAERGLSLGMDPNLPAIVAYRERLAAS